MTINHDNIIYVRDISEIGGVETFAYEMVKKYKDLDIAVVYKTANCKQLERLKKYCPVYKHINENIVCKVAIINYDTSIIEYITEKIWKENAKDGEGIFQTVHADYENPAYTWRPPTDKRIKSYITITKYIDQSFRKLVNVENTIQGYNPITDEEDNKIVLVSATRLSKIKGKDRMIKLANTLDRYGIDYIWYIFTNDTQAITNENIVYMKPRLDVRHWIKRATYLVQLSDTEGDPYSIKEAMFYNVPVIITPLPFLSEYGIEDGKNCYILNFDCSNINDIARKIKNVPKFKMNLPEDIYGKILAPSKSAYITQQNSRWIVRATNKYQLTRTSDNELCQIFDTDRYIPASGFEWETSFERKEKLLRASFINVVKEVKGEEENKCIIKLEKTKEKNYKKEEHSNILHKNAIIQDSM